MYNIASNIGNTALVIRESIDTMIGNDDKLIISIHKIVIIIL